MANELQLFRKQIVDHFNLADLQTLTFDLNLNWDELRGQILSEKAISLVTELHHQNRLPELITFLSVARPHLTWPTPDQLAPYIAASRVPFTDSQVKLNQYRQNLINNMRQAWIDGLLHHAIHQDIYLTLNKTYQRDAVSRFANLRLIPADEPISPEKEILDIFEEHGRSLLILGAPASGKTITLLQLAQALLDRAQQDFSHPIPIVLNLSSWGAQQLPMDEWIVEELFIQQQIARPLSRQWLEENQFTLLLDGLDEVAASAREACVAAVNEFKAEQPVNLVVCSRLVDYQSLSVQLNLPTAICLQPLTPAQIDAYLGQFGADVASLRNSLTEEPDLQELSHSPLMLSLMALAYSQDAPLLTASASAADKRQHLFATYSLRVFAHRPLSPKTPYDQNQAMRWLTNLAHGLEQHSQSIFYIERLQSTWLPQRRTFLLSYRLFAGLAFGLTAGLIIGFIGMLIIGLIAGLSDALILGLVFGSMFGLIFGLSIGLLGSLNESWFFRQLTRLNKIRSRRRIFAEWLFVGLFVGLLGGLFIGLRDGLFVGLFGGLFVGLLDAWMEGRIIRAIVQLTTNWYQHLIQRQQKKIEAAEDIIWQRPTVSAWWQKSKKGSMDGLSVGLIGGLIAVLLVGQAFWLSDGLLFGLIGALIFGLVGVLVFSLIFGLIGGLQAFIKFTQSAYPLQPNQGIHTTRRTMRRAGIPFAFINAAIGYGAGTLFGSLLNFPLNLQLNWPLIGLGLGLLGPLRYGGLTLWRHYQLRFRLSRQGVLPFSTSDRKLTAYLDDMVDHLLLRRVGGGWIFIHRYLQEHFAAQHPQAGQPLPAPPTIPENDSSD